MPQFFLRCLICFLVCNTVLQAIPPAITRPLRAKPEIHPERYEAWFTGSLLSPNGHNIPKGEVEIKPFIFASDSIGTYGYIWQNRSTNATRTINPVLTLGYGWFDWLDLEVTFQGFYKEKWNKHAFRRGDFLASIGLQLLNQKPNTPLPDLRFVFTESFPWGFYQRLSPDKNGTDSSGSGSWETSYILVLQKTFHPATVHFFNFQLSLGYTYAQRVEVHKFNTYGGGYETDATVRPKGKWTGIVSLEYSITQNLAFSTDFMGTLVQQGHVNGNRGFDANGNTATFDLEEIYQFSFAPALEWNFAKGLGIIGGVWMSFFGKEKDDFFSIIVGMNIRK